MALITAPGCEEGETLTIVDILRRAEIECDMVGLGAQEIAGTHHITVRCDTVFDGSLAAYDMVVLPGGYGGSDAMRDSAELIAALQEMAAEGKWVCAICAAPEGNAAVPEPLATEKVAVLMPEGCEESEIVQIMDLLMRTGLTCTSFATGGNEWVHTMKRATGYTGYGAKLTSAQFVADQVAVWDANVVASQGPCAPYPFAIKFMEAMGIDQQPIKDRLLYDKAGGR